MAPHIATKEAFDQMLIDAGAKLVVIDFTATWCGPCKAIAPIVEQLGERDDIVVVKVDVDDNSETAAACGISSMPTFQFYKNGVKIHQFSGANKAMLEAKIAELA
ncbi:thioredoxin [Pavlovales sp. CCMP2436]|nr:thioredoxin [Pavlovales sp. CCMP2436]|mmetsp:Transcript_6643/g.17304  ORF Transcript_6643/g.17304 Transcript_6643/m.17304 type:complete len:105 (-) Transcript_6643:305-619(-)